MKKTILLWSILFCFATLTAADSVYVCRKCRTVTVKDRTPSYAYCPQGNSHNWYRCATAGDEIYFCTKCELRVCSKGQPSYSYCFVKHGSHRWMKQGVRGKEHYQCRKCGMQLRTKGVPVSRGCKNNSTHLWHKL